MSGKVEYLHGLQIQGNDHSLGFVTGGSAHVQMQLSTKECENLGLTGLDLCSDCNTFAEYVKDQGVRSIIDSKKTIHMVQMIEDAVTLKPVHGITNFVPILNSRRNGTKKKRKP
ncbi:uncharacterized protein [Coffea arabica]|uniref:Uncharacterized protein isoform X2 n=1 Tax=Coffea arabica TaxID=13443 RepID=A0ABM4V4E9_COFAR